MSKEFHTFEQEILLAERLIDTLKRRAGMKMPTSLRGNLDEKTGAYTEHKQRSTRKNIVGCRHSDLTKYLKTFGWE